MDTEEKTKSVVYLFGCNEEFAETFKLKFLVQSCAEKGDDLNLSKIYPNIGVLQKGKLFSSFKKKHAEEAATAYNYLISQNTFAEFLEVAAHFKKILNEGLYLYAFSVALAHRKDAVDVQIPPHWQINPHNFFPNPLIKEALRASAESETISETKIRSLFVTGTYRDPEFKVSWWREDVGINWHHYHWHQVYPWKGVKGTTKDREGELFYYMHHQMVARYDAERLATGLLRVLPYNDWSSPIQEGYDSHLTDYYGSNHYSPRPAGMILTDSYHDPTNPVTVHHQMYNYNRLKDAINTGKFLKTDGSYEAVNINNLGAAVEASISSPNQDLYGSVHNIGHDLTSVITDPDGRYNQAMGVMGDTATAIRDPIFFRWHKFIDDLFTMYTSKLPPYTEKDLQFSKITLNGIKVQMDGSGKKQNKLITYMEDVKMDISKSMFIDKINPPTDVNVIVERVNHRNFQYTFDVTNNTSKKVKAAFRVFMAPRYDEHGQRFNLNDQLKVFIEMDKFVEDLLAGFTKVLRSSTLSSVVKPPSSTIKEILQNLNKTPDCSACRHNRYCECGWPPNALVPRGTTDGMKFDLFVMLTDWSSDNCTDDLNQGTSYCGVRDGKYPDGRAMGFPFDRLIDKEKFLTKSEPYIETFAEHFDNMMSVPISVIFDISNKTPQTTDRRQTCYPNFKPFHHQKKSRCCEI